MRIFGEVKGLSPDAKGFLCKQNLFTFKLRGDLLEIEYEGPCIDIQELMDDIASVLVENSHGHVDCIDHENWEVLRYTISQGKVSCKKVNPDHALEISTWR